jgi:cobalt-zinc-cadmium efflux system protein
MRADHDHDHSHPPASFNAAFGIGIALNMAFAPVSAGVVVAGGLTLWFGENCLYPLVSLLIAAVIVSGTRHPGGRSQSAGAPRPSPGGCR